MFIEFEGHPWQYVVSIVFGVMLFHLLAERSNWMDVIDIWNTWLRALLSLEEMPGGWVEQPISTQSKHKIPGCPVTLSGMWSLRQLAEIFWRNSLLKSHKSYQLVQKTHMFLDVCHSGIYFVLLLSGSICLDDHVCLISTPQYLSCICEINWSFSHHQDCH